MTQRRTGRNEDKHHHRSPRRRSALLASAATTVLLAVFGVQIADVPGDNTASAQSPRPATGAIEQDGGGGALQQEVKRAHQDGGFVSVSAEARNGERRTSARAGVADVETKENVPEEGSYRVGSVTKTFVATVLLQLEAGGKLSLHDSVEQWLPGLISGDGYDADSITLRNLLQHTSGLPNHSTIKDFDLTATAFETQRWRHYDPEELVAIALEHEPLFPPADNDDPEPDWAYSNTNYVVAGMVIEKATGHNWRTEVRDRILEPLGMDDTYAPGDDPRVKGPHAKTYKRFPESRDTWTETTVRNMSSLEASGELVSTQRDLDTFMTALLGGELLPERQLTEMQRTVPVSGEMQQLLPGARYGLSLLQQPLPCGGHQWNLGGQVVGGDTLVGQTNDGSRSIVIAATGMGGPEQLMKGQQALQQLMHSSLCGKAD